MKLGLSLVVSSLIALGQVAAHGHERSMHPREIASRQLEANSRHIVARNCASEIAAYQRKRKLARRSILEARGVTGTASALQPHETTIKNDTCVTAPEVTEGPYYLNNDLIRQDLREVQGGILLELDIGIIDTSTCQPLPNALVEIWNCNATGHYSGFSADTSMMPNGTFPGFNGTIPTDSVSGSGVVPSGVPTGLPGNFTGDVPSAPKADNENFLRGGWQTNAHGIVTFRTIYPGFYTGRAIHTHIMVHQNITYNTNGTYSSRSGSLVHVGQMFYDEDLNNKVVAISPYNTTAMQRTYNDEDSILAQENSNGYSGFVDASLIGSDISEGVLGFITVGVDSRARYSVSSYNYYATGELYESVGPESTVDVAGSTSFKGTTTGSITSSQIKTSGSKASSTSVHPPTGPPGHNQQPGHGQGEDHGQGGGHGPHGN